jgi:hypothetical protein
MDKPLFDLDQPGIEAEVNSYKPGLGRAWSILFPLKFTPKFDIKAIEGEDGIAVSADRVAFSTKAPLKTRRTVGKWSGKLGKTSISREKDEVEINEYNDLKTIAAANPEDKATARYLVDMVYDDVKFVHDGMDIENEITSLRIGSSGKHTFPAEIEGENATADEINFNVPEDQFVGVTTPWSNANAADGLGDIIKQQKAIARKGRKKPMWAIMDATAFEYLIAQEKTVKRIAPAILKATGLDSLEVISIDSVNSYMRKFQYPQILVLDSCGDIEKKDGTPETVRPWNENVVTLSPTPQLGWTYWKPVPIIPNTEAVQAQGSFYKVTVYSELNPMKEVTMAEAYLQPALINRASLVFMNTTKTTWSNGE